jgi:hypothetical protein
MEDTKKTAGRPKVNVTWPDGEFTVEQLIASTGLSKVTLYLKVKEALADKSISVTGKQPTPHGRPRVVFKKA